MPKAKSKKAPSSSHQAAKLALSNAISATRFELQTVTKWGYRNQQFIVDSLDIFYRPGTTDEKVIAEVLTSYAYQKRSIGFLIEPQDCWLDLGANIGTFALFALSVGGRVVCVEPEPENISILKANLSRIAPSKVDDGKPMYEIVEAGVSTTDGTVPLFLCTGKYNKYRHTMYPTRGRTSIEIKSVDIRRLLKRYPEINAIKMDIEGIEIDLLEYLDGQDYHQIDKLVFEYSFDIDPSIPRFLSIIDRLRESFKTVYYTKVRDDELEYRYFPPCTNVYCLK